MDFQFLHAADIHLDSPLSGLRLYDGAPVDRFRAATREALGNLVDRAIADRVAFVVIAGDLYDGDWPDFGTGLFLVRQLQKLGRAGIRVVVLFGNHDAHSRITRDLPWPDNAHRFAHTAPQTIVFDDLAVALHGQSFAEAETTANLAAGYPAPLPGRLNIGVLHTALEGAARHARYAPCSAGQLVAHGYDYWALGHVHERAIVHRDPWVVFPGNLQGRHIRETGAKGCMAVTVRDGRIAEVAPLDLDAVRWLDVAVDVAGLTDLDAVAAAAARTMADTAARRADGRPAAIRVVLRGETPAHARLTADTAALEAQLQAHAFDLTDGGDCWLESVRLATRPPQRMATTARAEAADLLAELLDGAQDDAALAAALTAALGPLKAGLPRSLAEGEVGEDAPLLAALGRGDMASLIAAVRPDLSALADGG